MTMRRIRLRSTLLVAVLMLGACAPAQSADGEAFAVVRAHPRWIGFVRAVQSDHPTPVAPERLEDACRRALDVESPAKPDDELAATCIRAALAILDTVSEYVDPAIWRKRAARIRSSASIGLELRTKRAGEPLEVVEPLAGAPGQRAGVRAGDRILEIDGIDVLPLTLDECLEMLRGESGTRARLVLRRGADGELLRLDVARDVIRVLSARVSLMLPERVVFVRLTQLRADTARQLQERLDTLRIPGDEPPAGLVLDLRLNTGGRLDAVGPVASVLAPPGRAVLVASTRAGDDTPRTVRDRSINTWAREVPIVVLVDGRTGGGAEALAQFLRESRGARLLGSVTTGEPNIFIVMPLDGAGLKLRVGTLVSPKGASWQNGLAPDIPAAPQTGTFEFGDTNDRWARDAAALLAGRR